jgi:hypothetical protein
VANFTVRLKYTNEGFYLSDLFEKRRLFMTVSWESYNYRSHFIRHSNYIFTLDPIEGSEDFKRDATLEERPGLADPSLVSFEATNHPGYFLRHSNFKLRLETEKKDDTTFKHDATFKIVPGLADPADPALVSLEAINFPQYFISVKLDAKPPNYNLIHQLVLKNKDDVPPDPFKKENATFRKRVGLNTMPKLEEIELRLTLQEDYGVRRNQKFHEEAIAPGFDSPVVWSRGQTKPSPPGNPSHILCLISDVRTNTSWPWPLYIQLTTMHDIGDAVGAQVRLIQKSLGWGTAFHAETYQDTGASTTIGVNIELHKAWDQGRSLGLNIQSVPWQLDGPPLHTTIDEAINIQSHRTKDNQFVGRYMTGLHFEKESEGTRAIWIEGKWDIGLDAGSSPIRMNAGTELWLEENGRFYMKYNPTTERIEFHNRHDGNDRVMAYIDGGALEHAL